MSRWLGPLVVAALLISGSVWAQTPSPAQPALGNLPAAGIPVAPLQDRPTAILQGLDKLTGRVSRLTVAVGSSLRFGRLDVVVRACRQAPPEEAPESAAFLEITENRPDGSRLPLFSGWMFASSPGLSALEHPTYDVWVVGCAAA